MTYRDEDEEAFYDACYENWYNGGPSGTDLSRDDFDMYRSRGYDREEAKEKLLREDEARRHERDLSGY